MFYFMPFAAATLPGSGGRGLEPLGRRRVRIRGGKRNDLMAATLGFA